MSREIVYLEDTDTVTIDWALARSLEMHVRMAKASPPLPGNRDMITSYLGIAKDELVAYTRIPSNWEGSASRPRDLDQKVAHWAMQIIGIQVLLDASL